MLMLEDTELISSLLVHSLDLLLSDPVVTVARGAYQLQPFLDTRDLVMLTSVLVVSKLDYCNVVHMGLPFKDYLEIAIGAECCGL